MIQNNIYHDVNIQYLIIKFDLDFLFYYSFFSSSFLSVLGNPLLKNDFTCVSKIQYFHIKCTNAICVQKIKKGRAHTLKIKTYRGKRKNKLDATHNEKKNLLRLHTSF